MDTFMLPEKFNLMQASKFVFNCSSVEGADRAIVNQLASTGIPAYSFLRWPELDRLAEVENCMNARAQARFQLKTS
jgi:hypothetical protein